MRKFIVAILCTLALAMSAEDIKRPESYNFVRGLEAIQNGEPEEALDYLNKEVKENPKNGYAFMWIAVIRAQYEEYGKAITAIDLAIKYIPKKDKAYLGLSYSTKSGVYKSLEEYDKALSCINEAIALQPEESDYYDDRAQLYYEQKKYDEADMDYNKMIALDSGNVIGYMGLGRNAKERKDYETAIKHFDYVIKLANEYSSGYAFRGECYIEQKKYNEAADDIVKALSINNDMKAFFHMQTIADSSLANIVTKLKVQAVKAPTDDMWPYYIGIVYERADQNKKAIEYYKESYKLGSSPVETYRIAHCYNDLGDYSEALKYADMTIQNDSTDEDFVLLRGVIYDNMGETKAAIADMDKYISMTPDNYFGYYRRGRYKDHSGDTDGAIEDYTTAITLNPDYAYTYLTRGSIYRRLGNDELSKADFEEVVKRDTVPGDDNAATYAYYYLGQKDKAIELMDKALKINNKGNYYDAACLYSIMGDTAQAMSYLRKALESGFRRFTHINRDRDMDNIRELPEFKSLMKEYQERHAAEVEHSNNETSENAEIITEVPFTKEGGVCKVKCTINDLPLHFIFDTGASNVSISSVEATFMLKNDYLKLSDILGKQQYMTANGEISEGTVIVLRNVSFGGVHLDNIKASVVKNQNAPLLLGQSVLNRLGKIEIDNSSKVLKITYKN